MKHIAMNPYLPLYEYIPDGEPRIFENRLFVYGSHDFAGGEKGFCPGDYMVWSAPLDDLGAWVCEGVAFPRSECPELAEEDAMAGADVSEGTGFEGHGFYEASSPRKINGKYVMVYSDEKSHQMSYAIAESPLGKYRYMGVLVSNADIGVNGNESPVMPYGNVHGGLVQLEDGWYIFYHRQTHAIECCRQGCAEKLPIRPDGWFGQAEITSCGLNGGTLPAKGTYNACYCCHLTGSLFSKEKLNVRENRRMSEGYIYEESVGIDMTKSLHYLANLKKDTVIGFKYFQWNAVEKLYVKIRGEGKVSVEVHLDSPKGECIGFTEVRLSCLWVDYEIALRVAEGVHALYLVIQAEGTAEVMEIAFVSQEEI